MGLDIKRNKKGLYKAKASISGQPDGDWITEDEFKKLLIEQAYWEFVRKTIQIDMEFPNGYYVNDKHQFIDDKAGVGLQWIINNWNEEAFSEKFKEICDRLKIEL